MKPFHDDEVLMERIASGDARAFRELSDTHLSSILTYATRLIKSSAEAEEIAQETFLRAWKQAAKYEPRAKVGTWLHAIARNCAIDRMRKQDRGGNHLELDDERDKAPLSDRPSRLLERKIEALSLERALASLPERQRSAIVLCHEQGLSNPEIAEVLDCSVEAVESLLSRGRRTLRDILTSSSPMTPQGDRNDRL